MGFGFELFGMLVLRELADGTYELSSGRAEEMFESVWVLFLALVSAEVFFTEDMDDGGNPYVESSQGNICGFR